MNEYFLGCLNIEIYPVSWRNAKCQKYKRRGSPVRQAEGIQKCVRKNIFSFTALNIYGNIHDQKSNKQASIQWHCLKVFPPVNRPIFLWTQTDTGSIATSPGRRSTDQENKNLSPNCGQKMNRSRR